ncbi:MAG TPA: DUF4846 domain-containing protein [Puia sp.]|jgi:hypothetical protein|nr:DUF4846 domain-containing protein [Puia sp.]
MRTLFLALLCTTPIWTADNPYPTIGAIPAPAGYHRVTEAQGSWGAWLRTIPLKRTLTVHLYNGMPKRNQDAQFAVLDVPVGNEDLQQCADAVMRLRAEYLYSRGDYGDITFYSEQGVRFNFAEWSADHRRPAFDRYLRKVFSYCSTRTLARQLVPAAYNMVEAGDVLIRSGSPGHAMLVVDVAEDGQGQRIYLLAQSYMPAQDIHIVKNPTDDLSPWYRADSTLGIVSTPEYEFKTNELRKWVK